MTGDADATEAQAARVMGAVRCVGEQGAGLRLLMQRMVCALGLPRQLAVGEDDVLCVLNVRNAAPRCQFGGHGGDGCGAGLIWRSAERQFALGAVGIVE